MSQAKTLTATRYFGLTSENIVAQAFWIATFASATAIAAQIEIPMNPVPFTLQTLFVLLSGAFLGRRNGFMSMSLYLILGLAGLPVFSGFGFGLAKLAGPTGGYLLAFPVASYVVGTLLLQRKSRVAVMLSMASGLLVIFLLGTIHLDLVYLHDWNAAMKSGFLVFSPWDLVKLLAASSVYSQYLEYAKQ
jgi:biotin transport system substrate-specific component